MRYLLLLSAVFGLALPAQGDALDVSGFVEAEGRAFPSESRSIEALDRAASGSFALQPEVRWQLDAQSTITVVPFVRFDADDSERTHWDLREANILLNAGNWDLRLGLDKVFWGVAESRHLADIINQTDQVEGLDEEDKLGQPMVNLNVLTGVGTLSGFLLPYFRERTFVGLEGRPALPLPVAEDLAVFEAPDEERHIDYAIRWQGRFGEFDIGLSHFHGTSREPSLVPTFSPGGLIFVPFYQLIDQTSLDAQATFDAWLLKLEAIIRSGQGDTFFAAVGGFEYTVYGVFSSNADLGVIAEYHRDERGISAPFTIFNNDLMVGARLALNDEDDTSLIAGGVVDIDTRTTFLTFEFATRLAEGWKLEAEARLLPYVANGSVETSFEREQVVIIRLQRFF